MPIFDQMKKWRSYISLMLAGVFSFNMLGFCFFSVLILTHKKSVFNKIVSGDFEQESLISLAASDLKSAIWEHEKEFEWNGEMFDVVKQKNIDGQIIYSCKKDTKEDHLKKQKRKAGEKEAGKKMVHLLKIFVQTASTCKTKLIKDSIKTDIIFLFEDELFPFLTEFNPPPKG
jgi:hypothetical protein